MVNKNPTSTRSQSLGIFIMAAPIKHTCPDIDKAIKHMKDALTEALANIEDQTARKWITSDIDSAIDYVEDLRSSNDSLRQWGKELEEEMESHANYTNDLEKKIEDLEQKIAEMENNLVN
jgi:DNA repair exonuclease SbcCD ATPase subunit